MPRGPSTLTLMRQDLSDPRTWGELAGWTVFFTAFGFGAALICGVI